MPDKELMKECEVYISHRFRVAIHLCLCGCKIQTVMPFDKKERGWNLIEKNGKISFTPSVGNQQFPCGSHYIITNNIANFV